MCESEKVFLNLLNIFSKKPIKGVWQIFNPFYATGLFVYPLKANCTNGTKPHKASHFFPFGLSFIMANRFDNEKLNGNQDMSFRWRMDKEVELETKQRISPRKRVQTQGLLVFGFVFSYIWIVYGDLKAIAGNFCVDFE